MKYMGSKRAMLQNGLGEAIGSAVTSASRFVDLFTGSAAVAWHVARKHDVAVVASDLQQFSVALAGAVITRTSPSDLETWLPRWQYDADVLLRGSPLAEPATTLQSALNNGDLTYTVERARELCKHAMHSPITHAYGGYYFSPSQALSFDALRSTLPSGEPARSIALAALIQAASRCAAAPGHTAQPFKPSFTAAPFLIEAWKRDVSSSVRSAANELALLTARVGGRAEQGSAEEVAKTLRESDVAFLDPPYSAVHYSRFYHVLETVAGGEPVEVSGSGRYPPPSHRPRSAFSVPTESHDAMSGLLRAVSESGASAILTFPATKSSNGLSGSAVREMADEFFSIESLKVTSRFSTLGGNRRHRNARQDTQELILTLRPH